MTKGQRAILIIGGVLCLLFAMGEAAKDYDANTWLATMLFLAAIAMFYLSARKNPTP